ncbi:hypothetical protein CHH28_03400 [Bacterioplanes sanyensis]|uniref:DUF350 domain-containing protein n=1 Tax=Bacterioplanes sanyensis TaxID=1249553 RepID=A0A222FFD1_9GAMM|nr:DUF350 domain-containing protein [Bacterioplanes sanyensis]ASP37777.1 hypothetical protein CHH28_03400 [Bacterioplanes sanyensis]
MLVNAIGNFALYFSIAVVALMLFKVIYAAITPHDEWQLIKEEANTAAAIAFGGAILGFAIALAGAISNSVDLIDFLIWGAIALLAQLVAFALVRFIFMPKIVARIQNNEVSAAIVLLAVSVSVGLLNAASLSY